MRIMMISQFSMPLPSPSDRIFAPGIIFSSIAEGLRAKGHEISVYAPADSKFSFDFISEGINSVHSLGIENHRERYYRASQHEMYMTTKAFESFQKGGYDLMHLDAFRIAPYFSNHVSGPITCTYHGIPDSNNDLKYDLDRLRQKRYYDKIKFVALSDHQIQNGGEYFNFIDKIPHGIDTSKFHFNPNPSDTLLFAGRLVEGKNPHLAIAIAENCGKHIKLVGDIDISSDYYVNHLKQYENNSHIKFCGHVEYSQMYEYFGRAQALLFPITWDEAFGLVTIEAMACGTPVIAFDRGPMREIIKDGVTGFVVPEGDILAMTEAVKKIGQIDRAACRRHVEESFSQRIMVDKYENLFRALSSQ